MELLKAILNCIPFAFPVKVSHIDLINMLARYLVHLDEGLREAASDALSRLMYSRPELRQALISGILAFITSISDSRYTLIFDLLGKVRASPSFGSPEAFRSP